MAKTPRTNDDRVRAAKGARASALKLVPANGAVDDVPVRAHIRAGQATRWIDLKGDKRFIKEIIMTYASKPRIKGQARVCVQAR